MINLEIAENIAIATIDQPNSKANILNLDFFKSLNEILERIEGDKTLNGLIFISAKPSIYLAGADLVSMKSKLQDERWLRGTLRLGQETFNRIERLSIPTVAAIHGACLGGGLELSLACKHRIASLDKCTKIGLPEVMLGILPAWGGTTRLPRIIGLAKALSAILSGKAYSSSQALKMGIIDEMCHKENLLKNSIKMCGSEVEAKRPNKMIQYIMAPLVLYFSRKSVMSKTKGNYPAPLKIIKVITKGLFQNKEKSLELEKKAFTELAQTEACRNLIRLFFLQEKSKKSKPDSAATDRSGTKKTIGGSVAVIGAGTMGAGIAQWISSKGRDVLLKDISENAVAAGLKKIGALFISAVLKHKIDRPSARSYLGRLATTTNNVELKNHTVVIEAVAEEFELKSRVLAQLESKMAPDSILATNTSALSVTELSKALNRPENFIGIHFFNPVHKMKLVEIVVGEKTSQETTNSAIRFIQGMGKLPVVVKDRPGFLVNRILLPYLVKALKLFSDGASIQEIDNAMLRFGMPMGPLRLLDEIGLDVAAHVALDLEKRLKGFSVPAIFKDILKTKKLGKKTKEGFYIYRNGKPLGESSRFLELQRGKAALGERELVDKMVDSMVVEAHKCLQENIASSEDDIDFAMVMGTGWAPFRGGPITYSKTQGPH